MTAADSGMRPTRDLLRDWRDGDARKLATMENESNTLWPGGGGRYSTPEEVERWIRKGDLNAAYISEEGERIVSLCTLTSKPGQREFTYIPHLVCHPDFHGKKHGKAVLHATVEHAYRAGFRKVDLHTWSGNMKAVPLYKKTGFMWRPESSVFMENFIPAARRHPLGATFFARHDWYATLDRALDLEEDLITRGQVRVYEYLWRAADGDFLRMVFDRQSWRLIEVETPELEIGCTLEAEKLVAGMTHAVRWTLTHRGVESVPVFLSTRGDPGVAVQQPRELDLQGTTEVQGSLVVDPELPEKTADPKAALLTTEIRVGREMVELTAGVQVQQAVEVSLRPDRGLITTAPGQRVRLTLRSHLDVPCRARVVLQAVHNVVLRRRLMRAPLAPRGSAEVEIELSPGASGIVSLDVGVQLTVAGRRIPVKTVRIDLLASPRDGLAAGVGEKTCFLCGGGLGVFVSRRWGMIAVHNVLRGTDAQRLHLEPPQLGPPFSWEDLFQQPAEAWTEEAPGSVAVHLRSRSVLHPGLVLDRCIRLDGSPLVSVTDTVTNGTDTRMDLSRRQFFRLGHAPAQVAELAIPVPGGMVVDRVAAGARSLTGLQPSEAAEDWPEGWLARASADGEVCALLWGTAADISGDDGWQIQHDCGVVLPGRTLILPVLRALVGEGDAHTARRWWYLLHGPDSGFAAPPRASVRASAEALLEPSAIIVTGDRVAARLIVRHVGTARLDGHVVLSTTPDLRVSPRRVPVSALNRAHPATRSIQIQRRRQRSSDNAHVDVVLQTAAAEYRCRVPVLLLPKRSPPVEITREQHTLVLDNGLLRVVVAPAFMGAAVSLRRGGYEYLNSSYPQAGKRGWRNPWYGGIHPVHGELWGQLHRERFQARRTKRRGQQGLEWRGVHLRACVQQEQARGQTLFIEYLLAPGIDVLAVVCGRTDTLGELQDGEVGCDIWSSLAPAPGSGRFHDADQNAVSALSGSQWHGDMIWRWGGLEAADGHALFLGSGAADAQTRGWSEGPEGCVLCTRLARPLPVAATVEAPFFLAPVATVEEGLAKSIWSCFAALP